LGFDPKTLTLVTLACTENETFFSDTKNKAKKYRYCQNKLQGGCNWLIPSDSNKVFCVACELNNTIPNILINDNLISWQKIEVAKHRLIYSLLRLNLPLKSKAEDLVNGLQFDFLADTSPEERVMTGHDNGIITLNINEANEVERTKNQLNLKENYRTLLGHMRHEIGHFYWDRLIMNSTYLTPFRALFGDEQKDYAVALESYYAGIPPQDWPDHFISIYATSHPWEDWAESFAHYLHMMDTIETAYSFGVTIDPEGIKDRTMEADIHRNPYEMDMFDKIMNLWYPLTFALNSLNRSMGQPDFYPFVISKEVESKLCFIHEVCRNEKKKANTLSTVVSTF
jgi:hypothetical protein